MVRVHRALTPKKSDDLPRDIIAKLNFYRTKEQLLNAARHKDVLHFQDHNYQLFADLSQLTINKRQALKPLLQIMQRNTIIYQWSFPFSVRFNYQNHKYTCCNAKDLQTTLQNIGLMSATKDITDTRQRSSSSSDNPSSTSRENENYSPNKRLQTFTRSGSEWLYGLNRVAYRVYSFFWESAWPTWSCPGPLTTPWWLSLYNVTYKFMLLWLFSNLFL